MPSEFPTGLDTFVNPSADDPLNAPSHADQHTLINDAMAAVQSKLGEDGSANEDSIDFRINALETAGHEHVWGDVPSGLINDSNVAFVLSFTPSPAASLMLFLNGTLQRAGGSDFSLVGAAITFVEAPLSGSVLIAHYVK